MSFVALILSVFTGVLIVLAVKPSTKIIQLLLSFSGAYLLSITVLHLLPEVFESHQKNVGIYILVGILIQTILEYFSKGAEHGHIHNHKHSHVKQIPWLLFFSLCIHAFLEGIPLNMVNGNLLLWAIVIHKIPVTVVLFVFLLQTSLSKKLIYTFILLFALMSPLGLLFSNGTSLFENYHTEITGVIVGVFLHIATAILFESSQNHKFNIQKFIAVLMGFALAFLGTQILGH
ncbi:ZIP family metal transporter [Aureibaculum sp. 2210JD6-5]|uniref:ZIP family metal transporter n=1 Tax=Aureibaculum sp. 2210JD6-5 TaxID=3103957 RepID=UPI002AAECE6A|nr:ZIP family metal transporter [Aureibaculum sp. 2210JD6-5]MDY7394273.1 ZIP family metal transporter [Aureibaculum sp. 2210JD6-5]